MRGHVHSYYVKQTALRIVRGSLTRVVLCYECACGDIIDVRTKANQ